MGFLKKAFNPKNATFKLSDDNVMEFFSSLGLDVSSIGSDSELGEAVYFICLKHLSETMSKMPWEKRTITQLKGREKIIDPQMDMLLNIRPNPYYSASTFWACAELNKNHYGNSYAYIESKNGTIKHLWILPSKDIQVWMDDKGIFSKEENAIWYVWTDKQTGKKYKFRAEEILHFKTSITFNGLVGMAVKDILKTQVQSMKNAQQFLSKLYESNMFGSKVIVHYTGELNTKSEEAVVSHLESYTSKVGSGKFIPMPYGMQAQLLDMKLSDAQFFENNKFSALQIAAAFGIKPNVINDYSKSSYKNSETQQIDFYVNTYRSS